MAAHSHVGFLGTKREFTVIILATESQLYPLCGGEEGIIKPLLSIAGRPLLSFQFELLVAAGFKHVLVVTSTATKDQVTFSLENLPTELISGIAYELVNVDVSLQTADVLIALHKSTGNYLQGDLVVLSADIVVDYSVALQKLVDRHRQRGSALTVLLWQTPPLDPVRRKQRTKEEEQGGASHIDYIGLDPEGRLLLFAKSTELNNGLTLRKRLIRRFPNLTISNSLLDAHCYVLSARIPALLVEQETTMKLKDIKGDLIPYLVRKQFRRSSAHASQPAKRALGGSGVSLHASVEEAPPTPGVEQEGPDKTSEPSEAGALEYSHSGGRDLNPFKCFAFVLKSGYCARANTIQAYVDLNRDVAAGLTEYRPWEPLSPDGHHRYISPTALIDPKTQIGDGCLVGEGTTLASSLVKRSTIGRDCHIGPNVKVEASVIMDRVKIHASAHIHGSVICSGAEIAAGVQIRNVVVGYDQKVARSLKDELFTSR